MVGGVNELSTRLAVPPVASARSEIGIPREPTSHTPKHMAPALDLRRKPGLNGTLPTADGPNWPVSQHYPTFAALATTFRGPQGGDAGAGAIFPAVAADSSDEPGVLGNLPRSRPGQRSEKRGGATRATAAAGAKPTVRARPAPKRKPATPRTATAERREPPAPEPSSGPPDPITAAFRVAGKVAGVGLRTAGGILRRLPGR